MNSLDLIADALADATRRALRDQGNRRKFEAWYEAKYGKPYVWEGQNEITSETV